jgi:hypothetical protein
MLCHRQLPVVDVRKRRTDDMFVRMATAAPLCLVVVGVLAGSVVWARGALAQGGVDEAEAEIRAGTELRHQNQDARALPHFERAYQISRNPRTAAQLGLVKMALGYCVDAERLLDEALAVPDHPWIARNAGALLQTRANARRNIGQVSVTGTPTGARILVNGRPAGTLPLTAPLRLDRGPVEIEVRAAGHAPFTRSLNVTGGGNETVAVTLVATGAVSVTPMAPPAPRATAATPPAPASSPPPPVATSPPVVATPDPPATDTSSDGAPVAIAASDTNDGRRTSLPLKPLAFTATGLAAAGLILGIVETITASRRAADFNNHTAASPTPANPDRRVPDCETSQPNEACRAIQTAHDRARTLAIVGYVGAGAFAVTSAALFVLATNRSGEPASPPVATTPFTCAPTLLATTGVSCRLTF